MTSFRCALLMVALATPLSAAPPREELLGTWRGTSTCVDKEKHPACNDEVVIYDFRPSKASADAVELSADKVVNGERLNMGVLEISYDAKRKAWTSPFTTRRGEKILWVFPVTGTRIDGLLIGLPDESHLRVVKVTKD
jgi:hypothetical protein